MIWHEDEVKRIEQEKSKLAYEPKIIFYGSSSIRLWDGLYEDFKSLHPINLGYRIPYERIGIVDIVDHVRKTRAAFSLYKHC